MIGALLLGFFAGVVGRPLTTGLGTGDTDIFDWGRIVGAIIGVMILLPFVGVWARATGRSHHH